MRSAGRQRNAAGGTADHERATVVNDIELAADRVDDDLVERLIVINRIAVQPVFLHRQAGDVRIQPPRII